MDSHGHINLMDHSAWPIFLRHPAAQQQKVLCKLLWTSRTLKAAVTEQCIGQAAVDFYWPNHPSQNTAGLEQAKQQLDCFVQWLTHNAHLLKLLQLDLMPPVDQACHNSRLAARMQVVRSVPDHKGKAEAAVAAALRNAAASGGPLKLQHFRLLHGRSTAVCILQQLPTTLTSLHLEVSKANHHLHPKQRLKGRPQLPSVRRTAAVIKGLTALTSLTIVCPEAHKLAPTLPALQQLQQLSITYLDVRAVGVLAQLAAQLSSLHFNILERYEVYYDDKDDSDAEAEQARQLHQLGTVAAWAQPEHGQQLLAKPGQQQVAAAGEMQPRLELGHLSTLRRVTSHTYRLQPEDVLPAGLTTLELGSCSCAKPLLHLKQLVQLQLHKDVPLEASELSSIGSSLTGLHSIGLAYQRLETAAAAAAAWPNLPVTSLELELDAAVLQDSMLQQIRQLGGLTRLCIFGAGDESVVAARPEEFGGVLQQLVNLQELELCSIKVAAVSLAEAAAEGGRRSSGLHSAFEAVTAAPLSASSSAVATRGGSALSVSGAAPADEEMSVLIAAIASLPLLSSLTLSKVAGSDGEWLGSPDLAPLAAATRLTCLHVFMSWLDDDGVVDLAKHLKCLQRLGLDHCARVTDEAAGVVVRELKQLVWLSVWGTKVLDGVSLKRLQPRLELFGC